MLVLEAFAGRRGRRRRREGGGCCRRGRRGGSAGPEGEPRGRRAWS